MTWIQVAVTLGMAVTNSVKRLFLRGIKWDAEQQNAPFTGVLLAVARASHQQIRDGSVLVSSGLTGSQVTVSFPNGLDPVSVASVASELVDLHEAVIAHLRPTPETPAPTDDAVFRLMLATLSATSCTRPDYRTLSL